MNQQDAITRLGELARRSHDTCEDSFYSCPKSPDGCANDAAGKECNCGADEHNAEVDRVLAACGHVTESNGWIENTGFDPDCMIAAVMIGGLKYDEKPHPSSSYFWGEQGGITHYKPQ